MDFTYDNLLAAKSAIKQLLDDTPVTNAIGRSILENHYTELEERITHMKRSGSYEVLRGARESAALRYPYIDAYAKTIMQEWRENHAQSSTIQASETQTLLDEVIKELEDCDKLSMEDLKDFSKIVLREKCVFQNVLKKLRKIQSTLGR